jgi:predicted RNA-binding Zn-ribbon protein involved in translation (DUF1610 family)
MVNEQPEIDMSEVDEYEKDFLDQYEKQKKKNTHIRRCNSCGYFMVSDSLTEKECPQCLSPMSFALFCTQCNQWYGVKTHKKYVCPTCQNLLVKKEKV